MILADCWAYRELFKSLTVRNLKVKYQRSVLGFVWTLLNPLLTVAVLAAVFTVIVRIQLPHYVAFLLSGYFVWGFLMQTLSAGTYMLAEHAQLIRSVAFPKEIPVLASTASRFVEFAIEMTLVLAGLAVFHHHNAPVAWLWLPWLMVLQVLLALGLAFPIAALAIFYQDIQHMLPIALSILFYVSPVFYPVSMVPDALQPYYLVNPLARLLTAYHTVVYDGQPLAAGDAAWLSVSCLTIAAVGYAVFNRCKAHVAEVV